MTATSALRLFIIAAAVLAVVLIVVLNHPMRHRLSFGHVVTRAGTCAVLLSVAYATAESYTQDIPGAPRLWFLAAGLIWLNVGCLATLLERRKNNRKVKR